MDYAELFRIFLRRWWLILLPLLLSAVVALPQILGASASSGYAMELRYSAAQRFNLPQREGDYTDIWRASEYTVDALTDWVRTSSFRAEIALQLDDGADALASLGIAADNARAVGVVYLSHSDGETLRDIGDAAMLVLAQRNQSYFPQLAGEAAQVTILDASAIRSLAPSLMDRLTPYIQLGIALLLGLALAVIAEVVDPAIYHQSELRRMGLPLLGSIPHERA